MTHHDISEEAEDRRIQRFVQHLIAEAEDGNEQALSGALRALGRITKSSKSVGQCGIPLVIN
jgi:hypothetical protein